MTKEDHTFLHDISNKLAKIYGFTAMVKVLVPADNEQIMKIEKATNEAIELVKNYRNKLESIEGQSIKP